MRVLAATLVLLAAACGGADDAVDEAAPPTAPTTAPTTTTAARDDAVVELGLTTVADGLETPWALAWDPDGELWVTERPGRLRRVGRDEVREIEGVVENGEAGLMGLEIDDEGRFYVMYTAGDENPFTGGDENRIVRLEDDGSQTVLVDGIPAAEIHDGGRLRFDDDGTLFATTGDAAVPERAPDAASLAGKILRVPTEAGEPVVHSRGHRNAQGLCFSPDGRLFATEHGPDVGDEINVIGEGGNGGWPRTSGNGIHNYTPTIAPAGCTFYDADLIPQWRGSLLFVTLKDESLRRLELDGTRVVDEEVLYQGELGRLRDVRVGPDGAVYLATSNRDGRGSPSEADDRIVRIAPAGE
jgi:aldose sugar dehydrogenase